MSEVTQSKNELRGPFLVGFLMARALEETANAGLEAEWRADHDELTGALNRAGLKNYLESAGTPKALLLVDATNFKAINDKFGYDVGDQVLKDICSILLNSTRLSDKVARWGGDEFVLILNGEGTEQYQDEFVSEGNKNNRLNQIHLADIDIAKDRIAVEVQAFLDMHPEFRAENFDLAVGGTEWYGDMPIERLIKTVQEDTKAHKAEQHEKGAYRGLRLAE